MKELQTKLLVNATISAIGSLIISLVGLGVDIPFVWSVGVLFTFFFILGTFFGDEAHNITLNWGKGASRAKEIIGNVLASILLGGGFFIIVCLLSIGLGIENIWTGIAATFCFICIVFVNFTQTDSNLKSNENTHN